MTAEALGLAVMALAPAGVVQGQIPPDTPLGPHGWRSVSVSIPGDPDRSDASTAQSYRVRVSVTVSTASEQGTLRVADELVQAFEGRRPVAAGWVTGPLLQDGMGSPYMAEATVQAANRRLVVLHFSFVFTASRLPA